MTIEQFRNFSATEKDNILTIYGNYTWDYKFPIPDDLFKFEYYTSQRFEQRKKNPNVIWPADLSKKEKVLCKIAMLKRVILWVRINSSDDRILTIAIDTFLKAIETEIYGYKYDKNQQTAWPGLSEDLAQVLNVLYKSFIKSLQKKDYI